MDSPQPPNKGRKTMMSFIKYKTPAIILGALLFALTFSSCTLDLSGSAGKPTETPAAGPGDTPDLATPAESVSPTPTPIPAASGRIIFTSKRDGQTDLYMTTPDGLELTRLTTNASVDESSAPQLSPDGAKVAFAATMAENTDIYVLDLATRATRRITEAPGRDSSPSWSPDGQRIVFESFRDSNLEIYIVNADGSNTARLTNDPSGDSRPIWSPNSNDILFVSNRFGNSDLLLLSPNGAVATLTTNPAPNNAPAWSPDGNFIAFQSFSGDLSQICLIGRDGMNQTCLTDHPDEYGAPVWSHNGEWIAVRAQEHIRLFNIKDGRVMDLSQPGIEPRGDPAWSPDGLRLVFQAFFEGDMELYHVLVPTNEFTRVTTAPGFDGEPFWAAR